jgi:hypothetical protein
MFLATFEIFSKPLKANTDTMGENSPNLSGVDVMITIFCDFCQFSAKNLRFSQKPMLWSQFLQKLAVAWAKNANIFAKFFVENI